MPAMPTPSLQGRIGAYWNVVAPRLWRAGHLDELSAIGLEHTCVCFSLYRDAIEAAKRAVGTPEAEEHRRVAAMWRIETREWAALYFVIPEERVRLGLVDADGYDAELRAWFAPAPRP